MLSGMKRIKNEGFLLVCFFGKGQKGSTFIIRRKIVAKNPFALVYVTNLNEKESS